jgi:SNF2 family DNA or RNA helicase
MARRARGRAAAAFKADGFDVRDFLLSSLGRAVRFCPILEDSLRGRLPDLHVTDAAGAVSFLTDHALVLEQAGFGVMLPAWWTAKGTKGRLSTRAQVTSPKMQGGNGLSLDEVVRFDWQVALGDQSLSREDLMALAKLKTPLVRVRGQWVLLDAEEIKDAIARLKRKDKGLTGRDALRIALGGQAGGQAGGPVGGDSVVSGGVEARGWIADVLARLGNRDTIEPLSVPGAFEGELRPYQERGYAWLRFLRRWGLGACLADDMGLGKTVQTLALILHDRETSEDGAPVLLVCPTSVIGNWQHEATRFTPDLAVMVHHGGARGRGAALRKRAFRHDLVITSYALLQRDIKALDAVPWKGVVLDEAQNIKNPETKQARAARALTTGYRIALTGTPVENNVGDLWSIMEFLNPGLLGTQTDFKRRFFVPIQANRDVQAIERLKALTGPFILRRLKSDRTIIADLPEKMEMKVYCNLTREQGSLYAAVVEEAMETLSAADGIRRRGVVLATLSKLKQVCNHPAQFLGDNSAVPGRSGKLARLVEMLEEVLEAGERALVFTQFSEMGEIIKTHLQETFGEEVLFLHGGVPKAKRDRMVTRFQAAGASVFLLSLKAGGTGLNLTAANHVFHFDRWWNPAVEDQATDRAFRIGQTRGVQVHKFLCPGTLEEKIDEMIERKKQVASTIVGAGEAWLTELTTEQLSDILSLREDAVGE